jgi:hypothetical protein
MINLGRRKVLALMLATGLVLAAAGTTALAAGSSVHVRVPHVSVNAPYSITASGSTRGRKHLYLFIDSKKCGANPAVEFSRTGRTGTAFGYYIKRVKGRFSRAEAFRTTARITDHACAYLTKFSAPKNSAQGVVARAFKTYTVH